MTHQMPMETQQELRQLPGNNRCVDCDAPYPQWATVSYGTFMCLECSGRHRGLGVHISFVRSVTMDSWTDKQLMQMQNGGNDLFRAAFSAAGVPKGLSIGEKYNTPQAEAYRQRLMAIVEGRAPRLLPQWDSSMNEPSPSSFSMKLREEARARMAAKFGSNGMQGIGSGGETRARQASSGGLGDLSGALSFITSTVTTAASSAASLVKDQDLGSKVSSGWCYVQNAMQDPAFSNNLKSSATSGWSVLSSGASALLQTAQTAVNGNGNANDNSACMSSAFPRTNVELPTSSKYVGIGSGNSSSTSRDHNNDSWLDSQLSSGGSSNSNSNSGSFYTPPQQPKPAQTSDLYGSSSSSANGNNHDLLGLSSSSLASATNSNGSAVATTAPPAAPVVKETKPAKDVDFFGEFGF
ncbi:unnamed protein product [Peronospora destructor]|uniref:Arf-GAP domain-containing protein n=1 Tax=Peronospora destructor TaxID=86335 RepID=A0AAV0V3R4_9STRA|nr:unnamed protein product [Peronospora destructor]